jgi:predicted transcriptional regulator
LSVKTTLPSVSKYPLRAFFDNYHLDKVREFPCYKRIYNFKKEILSMDEDLARCVGLWLAEGDTKTVSEISFTNNSFDLINLFYRTLQSLFDADNYRLYVYRPDENSNYQTFEEAEVSLYTDKRATQTYYILRLASRELVGEWKEKVSNAKERPDLYPYILQGFFAGEGSVYEGTRNSRRLRISQGERYDFIEKVFDHLNLDYYFRPEGRSYVITKKSDWDIFEEHEICKLHPRKREKFRSIYDSFQEELYLKGELKKNVYQKLTDPYRTKELAELFDRSQARLCDVVMELKEAGKITDYKAGSQSYWIRDDQNSVIISEVKNEYLQLLENQLMKVGKIADNFSITKNSAYKNLHGLEELGLIKKKDHEWTNTETEKQVIVL